MSRNQGAMVFIAALLLDIGVNYAMSPESEFHQYGRFLVVALAASEALGQLIVPALFIGIWAALARMRKLSLPHNFWRNGLIVMAGFCLAFSLSKLISAWGTA